MQVIFRIRDAFDVEELPGGEIHPAEQDDLNGTAMFFEESFDVLMA